MTSEPISSFAALHNRLTVSGMLEAKTAMRIGAGRDIEVMGNDLPVLRDARGRPIIPGASLKGAFRARLEALIRTVRPDQALDLNQLEARVQELRAWRAEDQTMQELRAQRKVVEADRHYTQHVRGILTLIDRTFGAPWIAGRVFFRDAPVDETLWFDQFEVRNGVAIDRDTETVSDSKLYDYEVVPAGTRFLFSLTAENLRAWQLGMLLLGLAPWQRAEVQIGGFRSRGLGHVGLIGPGGQTAPELRFVKVCGVESVLALLGNADAPKPVTDEQSRRWRAAFVEVLRDPDLAKEEHNDA